MVNTFLTSWPIEKAIRELDTKRLGKQRVEAYQILNCLLDAEEIIRRLNLPKDIPLLEAFKKYTFPLWCIPDSFGDRVYTDVKPTEPNARLVKKGFCSHPAVKMWRGYTDGLKYYINIAISCWVERGYSNTMTWYHLKEMPEFPPWTKSKIVHMSHRAALLRKEAVRNEPLWYWKNEEFTEGIYGTPWYTERGYLWCEANETNITESMCSEIKNDFV